MKTQAVALSIVVTKSFASLRHRPSQAKVRSTTQRCGKISKPFAWPNRLMIVSFHAPIRRALSGTATWSQTEILGMLQSFLLDSHTLLSCIAVETLPGTEPNVDPLGVGLGYERFLRTSPLTPLPTHC
jgi:hypothetical protein